jgi:signal transduction histidine kinase
MRSRLLWKLVGINIPVIGVVILMVWLAIDYLAADYFMVLMKDYNISPTSTHQMFLDAVHRYLIRASLFALAFAVLCSFFLTRKVLRPLSQMTEVIKQIAAGDYTARAQLTSKDEVGQLAVSFNHMADSLQRIEHLRQTMVSDVAHELRTPLTNMRGYLEALRDGVVTPNTATFELLHEETLRLANLVEDLLQLTRADAARVTLQRQSVALQELISHAVDLFQPQFVVKAITVKTVIGGGVNGVMADPDKLSQAVRNLLQNAWQYTPPGGDVCIVVERQASSLTLSVSNTGEGISPADLPFIFERFYRGEKSRSREWGGAGVGLAIVKELIEAHGGQVGAESSADVTRIWFTLPV